MLAWFRKLLENWLARVFFALLSAGFVFWGISNVVTLVSSSTVIAHVAGVPIELAVVQAEYHDELNQAEQKGPVDAGTRQQIAQTALTTVLRDHALAASEASLGLVAPDSAVRAEIDAMPAFQTNGAFDPQKFAAVLQQNGYAPAGFIGKIKAGIADRQLIPALTAGAAAPAPLVAQIFAFIGEARTAETVTVTTAAQPAPPPPSEATLRRYWKNHPQSYQAPEYRTIKLVILSPVLLAPAQPVTDAQLQAAYARFAATQKVPASRSVQVVTCADQAKAAQLAATWRAGANWAAIQAAAAKLGAAAVELDHQQPDQFPSQTLSDAVFAAAPGAITGPIAGAFGYFVFDVTDAIAAGAPPLAQVAGQLKQDIQLREAQDAVNQDVDNVQDALAGETPLDQLPGNLGLTAVEGTLDSTGATLDGTKAPIPGGDALRDAVVKAVFAAHIGDPAQLIAGPAGSYFAFTLDKITPPAAKPFEQVQTQVAADWTAEAQSRAAEQKAAAILQAVNTGKSLDDAAAAAGLATTLTAPITRGAPPNGFPQSMVSALFALKQGQAMMQPTPDGFMVAALTKITPANPAADPQDQANISAALTKSLQNDVAESFLAGLQAAQHISVDPKLVAQITQ